MCAEAASGWVSNTLQAMDHIQARLEPGNIGVMTIDDPFKLQREPSEYWQSNCWTGASFRTREDAEDRAAVGIDKTMWGSVFPHDEGTHPHTREALAPTYAGIDPAKVSMMLPPRIGFLAPASLP